MNLPSLYPPPPQQGQLQSPSSSSLRSPSPSGPTSSRSALGVIASPSPPETVTSYLVSTKTDLLQDLRLQITPALPHYSKRQTALNKPPRPLYFRERTLSLQNEIVDEIIDATTGHPAWTIHRPTRGWYLHIRSPALPPGFAIPLSPARPDFIFSIMGVQDPTSTPLTFVLSTCIHAEHLLRCKTWIKDVEEAASQCGFVPSRAAGQASDGNFLAVDLNGEGHSTGGPASSGNRDSASRFLTHAVDLSAAARRTHNAKTYSVSSSARFSDSSGQLHARQRSSGRTPISSPDVRMNLSGKFEGLAEVTENKSGSDVTVTPASKLLGATEKEAPANRPPEDFLHPPTQLPASARQRPSQCCFLLLDGVARLPSTSPNMITSLAPGRIAESSQRLGWAKWVWSLVPEPIRPPLSFDTTKSFSVRWHNASCDEAKGQHYSGADGSDARNKSPRSVEIMRYEDEGDASWSVFNSKTRGKFVFQEEAIMALGVDRGFWIAVSRIIILACGQLSRLAHHNST